MGAMSSAQEDKAAELLGQVQWVRAFTRSLVQDVHVAEDLAQETWVQALGQGRGEVRTPRAWMAGVARNLFRSSLRRERQRPQVEAEASSSEDVVSSQDLCARASQQRLLVGELLRLQEPYRTTLLLRFFEDLSQKEIARRMQVPVSTVGTRIARGLALMRAQLRARTGSRDDTAWVSALLPVLGRERSTVTSSSTLPWISPLAMAPPTKVALSLLVLAGSALLVGSLRSMDSPGHPRTEAAQVADPRAVRPTALVVGQADPAPISVREELEEPRAEAESPGEVQPPVQVLGQVIDLEGRPVVGVEVCARSSASWHVSRETTAPSSHEGLGGKSLEEIHAGLSWRRSRSGPPPCATSGKQGRFALGPEWPSLAEVVVHTPDYTTVLAGLVGGEGESVQVVVAWRLALGGQVVGEDGEAIEGARLTLILPTEPFRRLGLPLDDNHLVPMMVRSGQGGRFSFEDAADVAGSNLMASAPGYETVFLTLPEGGELDLQVVLRSLAQDPGSLVGRVVAPGGHPVAGARVSVGSMTQTTDEEGRFVLGQDHLSLELLPPGERPPDSDFFQVTAVAAGYRPDRKQVPRPDSRSAGRAPEFLVLELGPPPLQIAGRVLDQDGEPCVGVELSLRDRTPFGMVMHETRNYATLQTLEDVLGYQAVLTDSTGAFRIQGLEPRRYVLEAIDKVSLASVRQEVVAGDEDVLLSFCGEGMGPLAGRVVDLAGEPLPGVAVQLSHAVSGMGFTFGGRQVSDEDGAFRFERAAGDATLSLSGRTIVPELSRTVPEGDRERLEIVIGRRCHLQIEWGAWEGEDVEGYVVDAEGKPVVLTLIQGNGWGPRPRVSSSAALSEVLAVSQAAKTLILEQEGSEVQRVPLELVPGEVTLVRP